MTCSAKEPTIIAAGRQLSIHCQLVDGQQRCPNWAHGFMLFPAFDSVSLAVCAKHAQQLLSRPPPGGCRAVMPDDREAEYLHKEARQWDEYLHKEAHLDAGGSVCPDEAGQPAPAHQLPPGCEN